MTSPPLISWIGAMFTRLKGGRFAFWVMDLNPDEAIAAGWLREGAFVTRVLQAMLNDSLERSSLVVVLDRFMARRIEAKGVESARVAVLPPWSMDQAVRYDDAGREAFRAAHGLDGKFVVMYSGNHSPCHPLTTLLEAATALKDRGDIVFVFAGGGSELKTVRRAAAGKSLGNVKIVDYQPLAQLSASLSAADLHVVVMGDPFVGTIHPSKVYNIRALGIPFLYIGPSESHVAELEPEYSSRHGDVSSVVRHIEIAAAVPIGRVKYSGLESHSRTHLLGQLTGALEGAGRKSQIGAQLSIGSSDSVVFERNGSDPSQAMSESAGSTYLPHPPNQPYLP
jgi:hypothetical protein